MKTDFMGLKECSKEKKIKIFNEETIYQASKKDHK